jgi:hypothetical protein
MKTPASRICLGIFCIGVSLCISILCARPLPSAPARTSLQQKISAVVPFVGCKSSRILEPMEVPKEFYADPYRGKPLVLRVPAQIAQRLAYYKSEHEIGALAPRGWHCFDLYESRGATLYVSPQAIDTVPVLSRISIGLTGPAIEIDYAYGGTSGRYEVARVIARVFPNHRVFVESLIKRWSKEGIGSGGPDPIRGVAILVGGTPDLVQLSARLPANLADLEPTIIHQVERDAAHAPDYPN